LYVASTYAGQPILELNETQLFEFRVYDHAYPLQTSSTARSRLGVNRPTGYMSLTGRNWVCSETITSTLHIIARAEGWGLQAMPPQPRQTVWLGNSSFWSQIFSQRTRSACSSTLYTMQESRAPSSDLNPRSYGNTRTALFYPLFKLR